MSRNSLKNKYKRIKSLGYCEYCLKQINSDELTVDHIYGRANAEYNLVACCIECNGDKSKVEDNRIKCLKWPTSRMFEYRINKMLEYQQFFLPIDFLLTQKYR